MQVNLHFVMLEELPESTDRDAVVRIVIIREMPAAEPFFDNLLLDPEQEN